MAKPKKDPNKNPPPKAVVKPAAKAAVKPPPKKAAPKKPPPPKKPIKPKLATGKKPALKRQPQDLQATKGRGRAGRGKRQPQGQVAGKPKSVAQRVNERVQKWLKQIPSNARTGAGVYGDYKNATNWLRQWAEDSIALFGNAVAPWKIEQKYGYTPEYYNEFAGKDPVAKKMFAAMKKANTGAAGSNLLDLSPRTEEGHVFLTNGILDTNYQSFAEIKQEHLMPSLFAGIEMNRAFSDIGGWQAGAGMTDDEMAATMSSMGMNQETIGAFLEQQGYSKWLSPKYLHILGFGRPEDINAMGYGIMDQGPTGSANIAAWKSEQQQAFTERQKLVPDWAKTAIPGAIDRLGQISPSISRDNAEMMTFTRIGEVLSSPDVNYKDFSKPFFSLGKSFGEGGGAVAPAGGYFLTYGAQTGTDTVSNMLASMTAEEWITHLLPTEIRYHDDPEFRVPGNPEFEAGLSPFGQYMTDPMNNAGMVRSPIYNTPIYQRWSLMQQPGDPTQKGWLYDNQIGIAWNTATGEVQFFPGSTDQADRRRQQLFVDMMSGKAPVNEQTLAELGSDTARAIATRDPTHSLRGQSAGDWAGAYQAGAAAYSDPDFLSRIGIITGKTSPAGFTGGAPGSSVPNALGQPNPYDPGGKRTGSQILPSAAGGPYHFTIRGQPVVAPKAKPKPEPTKPREPIDVSKFGTSTNPQLPQKLFGLVENPAGAFADPEFEAQRAALTQEYESTYNEILRALGTTDPTTGQKMPGLVEQEAERARQEALRGMALAGQAEEGRFQRGGALFSGRYGEARGRAEYPFIAGMTDISQSTADTLAQLHSEALDLIKGYEAQNSLLLADLARRRTQSGMQQIPGV